MNSTFDIQCRKWKEEEVKRLLIFIFIFSVFSVYFEAFAQSNRRYSININRGNRWGWGRNVSPWAFGADIADYFMVRDITRSEVELAEIQMGRVSQRREPGIERDWIRNDFYRTRNGFEPRRENFMPTHATVMQQEWVTNNSDYVASVVFRGRDYDRDYNFSLRPGEAVQILIPNEQGVLCSVVGERVTSLPYLNGGYVIR